MFRDLPKKYVNVFMTEQFIELQSYREHSVTPSDTIISSKVFTTDLSDEELGRALSMALSRSSVLPPQDSPGWASHYGGGVEERVRDFDYEDAYSCFQNMNSCFISSFDGRIMIRPQHHVELVRWAPQEDEAINFFFPENISPAELGAGLRLAFSHCTSEGNFDPAELPDDVGQKSRLRFEEVCNLDVNYSHLEVFFYESLNPFMDVIVSDDRELVFFFYPSCNDEIQLNLVEWAQIELYAEMFLPETLKQEDNCQKYNKFEKRAEE